MLATDKFTGKERDTETGNDYFSARYYGSNMGRWLSPDWAAAPTAVPYAHFGDPQSLNLYSYGGNNPTTFGDSDGHCWGWCADFLSWAVKAVARDGSVKAVAQNVGIGAAKGAGTFAVNTLKTVTAGAASGATNPAAAVQTMMTPGPKALQPSNQTQAQASAATQIGLTVASVAVPAAMSANAARGAATAEATTTEVLTEGTVFRSGGTNPSNIAGADLSFRDSLSNPIGSADNPVFAPGDKYFGVEVSRLPEGSAVLDNNPAGHVTVNAPADAIKDAVVVKGKLPKVD